MSKQCKIQLGNMKNFSEHIWLVPRGPAIEREFTTVMLKAPPTREDIVTPLLLSTMTIAINIQKPN